ncbi:MAG TPA: site-specific integrase [Baekduia sp.]|nr:site-specific integrase [Baekduia sp.]
MYVYDPAIKAKRYVGSREKLRDARELEREKAAEFAALAGRKATGDETMADYAAEWLEHHHGPGTRRPRPTTRGVNEANLRPFLSDFGARRLDGGITRTEALRWARQHQHNAKTVSAMLNDAVDEERCAGNPFANRRQPEGRERKFIHPLTEEEVDRLATIGLRTWGEDGYGRVVRAWILFGAWVGCRPGETFSVERQHLDFAAGEVRIRRVKKRGGSYPTDTVVLPRAAIAALRAIELPKAGPIFTTVTGAAIVKGALRYYWDPIRTAFRQTASDGRWEELLDGSEDGKSLDYYCLRHFCASQIVARGGNEYDVSAQLGNSPQVARETYIHSYVLEANERNRRFLDGGADVVELDARRRGA